jgi:hypothetical protein
MAFERYERQQTCRKFITICRNGQMYINKGIARELGIESGYADFLFDRETARIGLLFSKEPKYTTSSKVNTKSSGMILCLQSFVKYYGIKLDKRLAYDYKKDSNGMIVLTQAKEG